MRELSGRRRGAKSELSHHRRVAPPWEIATRADQSMQIVEPTPTTPEEFRARIDTDIARWKPVIAAANIKVN